MQVHFHALSSNQVLELKPNSDFADLTSHFHSHFQISLAQLATRFDPPFIEVDFSHPIPLLTAALLLHVSFSQSSTLHLPVYLI
jgi:hypothetical protein